MNASASNPIHENAVPLVVDVDGTLLKTDLLAESFRVFLLTKPLQAVSALTLVKDKAAFKKRVADSISLNMASLPVNEDVIALIHEAKSQGRRVYLASASDWALVKKLAEHINLFDGMFASDGVVNLKGEVKAQTLCNVFGERGFDYIGNESADFPVWQKAREVIVVGNERIAQEVLQRFPNAQVIDKPDGINIYARALRIHQWSKNFLIFVPLILAHKMGFSHLLSAFIAFLSFSLCASSVYLLNDWFDLDTDRHHPVKHQRMLASGGLSLLRGMQLIALLLLSSIGLALILPLKFLGVLTVYYAITLAYSLWLKRITLIDMMTLACLYGLRLICGATLGIELSEWLVAFSVFLFLSLAIIKRCIELINCSTEGRQGPAGRGYTLSDTPALFTMATASGYIAVLVLALYIQNPYVSMLYSHPSYLWGACLILAYWISRMLILTARGNMHEDPVIFAITDRGSLICGALLCALLWIST